jgi:hypothetical protein
MDETTLTKKPEFPLIVGHISEIVAGLARDVETGQGFGELRRDAAE